MKREKYLLLLLLTCFISSAFAQNQRNRETIIADIVMQLPAKNTQSFNQLMNSLIQIDNVVPDLASKLVSPGQGDDAQLREAINGLTFYASRGNSHENKSSIAAGLCKAINLATSDEVKDFLLVQLQYVAGDESVETVKHYLISDRLCDPAARVLVRINSEASKQALLEALKQSGGIREITLVQALGQTQYAPALDHITSLIKSRKPKLRRPVLQALAQIASPSSEKILREAVEMTGYTYESTDALAAYLLYLKNLNAKGQQSIAAKASKSLLKKASIPQQTPAKCAALELYTLTAGEKAISEVTGALNSNDKRYREAALLYARNINSPKMIAELINTAKSANNEVKAGIITSFGINNDKQALKYVLESLKNKDTNVAAASIIAAGRLGGEQAVNPIIKAMNNGNQIVACAGRDALLSINSQTLADQVADAIPGTASTAAKAALLDLLAQKQAIQHSKIVFTYTITEDTSLRKAAYNALKGVVSEPDLDALAFQLTFPRSKTEINAIQEALYSAVKYSGDQSRQTDLILNQMNKAENKNLYYNTLSMIGGNKALGIVSEAFKSADTQTKNAAFEALIGWNGFESANVLYAICKNNPQSEYFNKALTSYVTKTSLSGNTKEQKLLLFRNALEIAETPGQKTQIIDQIANTGTFPGLIVAGKYLDDPDESVRQAAVQAVRNIAINNPEYYGETVSNLLTKAIEINTDPEAAYQKQAIEKHLASLPQENGFTPMFNEKDLTGWKGLVENPIARSKMKSAQLAKAQKKADEVMRSNWKVENGMLVYEGKGFDNICSDKKYADFELYVDWKIGPKGDAGVYLRGTPQVQIWDTSLTDVGAEVGSGGLYNNRKNPDKPLVVADNPVNEWNSFRILMTGDKVTVYLNGKLTVDNVTLENYWNRKTSILPLEAIELQAHGSRVEYRDIYIREIPRSKAYEVSKAESKEGFVPMFNGIDMEGWEGNLKDYITRDGMIVCDPSQGGRGNLYTEKEYSNFIMRFEFQLTPAANNGLGIRTPLEGDAAYEGMEIQILDNEAEVYKDLQNYQYHGSVYGVIPAQRGFLKPVGQWNQQEVIARGNRITVILNETVILDDDISLASNGFTSTIDGKKHPGLSNKRGHIGFLGHGSEVAFKNIRIKDLSKGSNNNKDNAKVSKKKNKSRTNSK